MSLLRLDGDELRGRWLLAGLMKLLAGGRFWLEAKMSEAWRRKDERIGVFVVGRRVGRTAGARLT